ncbi:trypsin-like peptidase domain-containing protein [Mycobacterium sp. pW049]|uniref:trypsin-like peptidase domain-containing protein n=1 Tax=[Mycobacterium] bulgaricum TaxID=3238985 RepID=UPI00351BCF1E
MSPLLVQNLVGRIHLYSAAAITAQFYNRSSGATLKPRYGTTFHFVGQTRSYFVTNRHILDYNYRTTKPLLSSALESVSIRGFTQPEDAGRDTQPWTYSHADPSITFPDDDDIDLALISIPLSSKEASVAPVGGGAIPHSFAGRWLAKTHEVNSLLPGDQVFIAGYPGLEGEISERPLIVSGIVSSDPRYPATFAGSRISRSSVLCHSFSWGGMSGAPVFGFSKEIGRTAIVGVNAGHIASNDVSGGVISHFVRSDALVALLATADGS